MDTLIGFKKALVIIMVYLSPLQSLGFDRQAPEVNTYFLTGGFLHYTNNSTEALISPIYSLIVSISVSKKAHIGIFTTTNSNTGLMLGMRLTDNWRIRYLMGNAPTTMKNKDKEITQDKIISFGLGVDYSISEKYALTTQAFTYTTGDKGINNEVSLGLRYTF